MGSLELVFNTNEVKQYLKKNSMHYSDIVQRKIELIQNKSDCYYSRNLIIDLIYQPDGINCGFGCQMHSIASGFLCAFDTNRLFLIKNYENANYQKYFVNFNDKCKNYKYSKNYISKSNICNLNFYSTSFFLIKKNNK